MLLKCFTVNILEGSTFGVMHRLDVSHYYGNNAYREKDNTRVYNNRSLKIYWTHLYIGICPDVLITDGCFTGIESWSPKHDTIKGFPWNWYIKGKLITILTPAWARWLNVNILVSNNQLAQNKDTRFKISKANSVQRQRYASWRFMMRIPLGPPWNLWAKRIGE